MGKNDFAVVYTHRCKFCHQRLQQHEVNDHRYYVHQRLLPAFDEINVMVEFEVDDDWNLTGQKETTR